MHFHSIKFEMKIKVELKIIQKISFKLNYSHFRVFFMKIASLHHHPKYKPECYSLLIVNFTSQDKNCVMTMLCQVRSNDLAFSSSLNEIPFASQPNTVIIHNANNKILHYDQVKTQVASAEKAKKTGKYISVPVEVFQDAYRAQAKQVNMPADPVKPNYAACDSDIGIQSAEGRLKGLKIVR